MDVLLSHIWPKLDLWSLVPRPLKTDKPQTQNANKPIGLVWGQLSKKQLLRHTRPRDNGTRQKFNDHMGITHSFTSLAADTSDHSSSSQHQHCLTGIFCSSHFYIVKNLWEFITSCIQAWLWHKYQVASSLLHRLLRFIICLWVKSYIECQWLTDYNLQLDNSNKWQVLLPSLPCVSGL